VRRRLSLALALPGLFPEVKGGGGRKRNAIIVFLPRHRAHAGVEFQPTPNVSLSLGFG
jgi:hypothetical protein